MNDLIVRQARLLGEESLHDIKVKDGRITAVSRAGETEFGAKKIDAEGRLMLPGFVEPHVHLDKVLLAEQVGEAHSIVEARELVKEAKKKFTVSNVTERVEKIIPWIIQSGVIAIRTHADVDNIAGLVSLEALLSLREKYRDKVEIQIVAFPQEGIFKDSSSPELLRKALGMGADVVGGLPEAERSADDSKRHLDFVITLAKETGKDVDIHCDVLPSSRLIDYYASQIIAQELQGRATADHLIALSYYDENHASSSISLIKRAGINVIASPCTTMNSGISPTPPLGRGVTRIKEILHAGINMAYGIDNIIDPYNPFGDFDPLSSGWLFAYLGQLNSIEEMNSVIRMPTYNSASILRMNGYGLRPGDRADFNILNAKSVREALRTHLKPRYVVKQGEISAENIFESKRHD